MQAKDIIKKKGSAIFSIGKNDMICNALETMNRNNIGVLMVMEDDEIQGIISERDILRLFHANSCSNGSGSIEIKMPIKVADIMTNYHDLVFAKAECKVDVVMDKMVRNHIRHIPVLENDKLLGIISMRDVIKTLLFIAKREKQILEDYITSSY